MGADSTGGGFAGDDDGVDGVDSTGYLI